MTKPGFFKKNNTMHCLIDVQRAFCDPRFTAWKKGEGPGTDKTAKTAGRIAAITPLFRAAGVQTCIIYTCPYLASVIESHGGLYKIERAAGDHTLVKNNHSAFSNPAFEKLLRQKNIETLLISGFNLSICVEHTVNDALARGFNIVVMSDCVDNNAIIKRSAAKKSVQNMMEKGAQFLSSSKILPALSA